MKCLFASLTILQESTLRLQLFVIKCLTLLKRKVDKPLLKQIPINELSSTDVKIKQLIIIRFYYAETAHYPKPVGCKALIALKENI